MKKNIGNEKQKNDALSFAYDRWHKHLENNFMHYLFSSKTCKVYFKHSKTILDLFLKSAIHKKLVFLNKLKDAGYKVEENLNRLESKTLVLADSLEDLTLREEKTNKKLQEKNQELKKTLSKKERLRIEIENLNKTEKDLVALLKKLRNISVKKTINFDGAPKISANSLSWPVNGKVISKFGRQTISSLDVEIDKDGIEIQTSKNAGVHPVASGVIIYAGAFKSYRNVVIIDHGDEFFSIYGFLNKILAKQASVVTADDVIGHAGRSIENSLMYKKVPVDKSVLYFEIRSGTKALNPLQWLK